MTELRVGGLTPLTTVDYPGGLAAVVFCQGCLWRCPYCHNPHLQPLKAASGPEWAEVLTFLRRRVGLLDAVVFSGGEPLLQEGLEEAVPEVRDLGFRVGLHTGGGDPARLARVLPLVDWVGMDLKAPFDDYARITKAPGSGASALASARMLIESGVAHEFRTTFHPALLDRGAVLRIAEAVASMGGRRYVLQEFRAQGCEDSALTASLPSESCRAWCPEVAGRVSDFELRSA